MYAMNIQNDVIGLVQRENCKSKQMTNFFVAEQMTRYCQMSNWLHFVNFVYLFQFLQYWRMLLETQVFFSLRLFKLQINMSNVCENEGHPLI